MRNRLFLLSAAVLLAACADDQHATAPSGPSSGAANRSAVDAYPPGPSVNGKPAPAPAGWTHAITVGSTISVAPGTSDFATAICPAGTTVVGGGFSLQLGFGTPPVAYINGPNAQGTGWDGGVHNTNAPGGSSVIVSAFARCAS